jgi:hypothetical protein
MSKTSIKVNPETRDKLFQEKRSSTETYDDVLNRLLNE